MREAADVPFRRIGIVGLGLVGGSVALAARAAWPSAALVGIDAVDRSDEAIRRGMLTDTARQIRDLATCDLIVIAVPLDAMGPVLHELAACQSSAVVTDVGSVKRPVMRAAAEAGLECFTGGHPMAGAERPGLEHARVDLFQARPWLLVRGNAPASADRRLEWFLEGLGARVRWVDADAHDRSMAFVSHLPQILATALMNAAVDGVGAEAVDAAGPAFADMTRLAASPSSLWQAILSQNADYVNEALREFARQLPTPEDLAAGQWVHSAFERAGVARERWRTGPAGRPAR